MKAFLLLTVFIVTLNASFESLRGEVMLFAGDFAPRNWAECNGQLLPISQNYAMFSIVGIKYGGDGVTTYGLPSLTSPDGKTKYIISLEGIDPSRSEVSVGGSFAEPLMGSIMLFAGDFTPQGYMECNGQLLSRPQNTALFSILGITYGGDGQSNFGLPNLTAPDGKSKYLIAVTGIYPSRSEVSVGHANMEFALGGGAGPLLGEVMLFAGNFVPRYWKECNGELLDISAHDGLFTILETTYGGDRRTTFGLPNLTSPDGKAKYVISLWGTYPSRSETYVGGGAETMVEQNAQLRRINEALKKAVKAMGN